MPVPSSAKTNHPSLENNVHRLTIDFSVYYATQPATAEPPRGLLLALHGFGQTCERFLSLFSALRPQGFAVIAPQAPNQFYVKMSPKIVGFSWLTKYQRDQSTQDFIGYMHRLLAVAHKDPRFATDNLFLLGFSQGVSMAYRFAVRCGIPLRGVIACSADLPQDVAELLPQSQKFPILLTHGREDTLAPMRLSQAAADTLRRHGFAVEEYYFPGGHEIPAELVQKAAVWMRHQLPPFPGAAGK